ncbi:MAG: hypothetical protein QXG36_05485 [Nitrososphaeria archaeon]
MNFWIFSSKNIENIKVAKERLLWGFWDRELGDKQRQNWRSFIRLYNKIRPFDIVFFQVARTGEINAIGIVKGTYYDDQTPVWPGEQKQVLFPWKVSFCSIIFSEKPFITHFVKIESYVDGYGIGELPEFEFRRILKEIQEQVNIELNIG